MFDSHPVSTINEWTQILDQLLLLSTKSNTVSNWSVTFFYSMNNLFNSCCSFASAHPYIVGGSIIIVGSVLLWYSGSLHSLFGLGSDKVQSVQSVDPSQITELTTVVNDLVQREAKVVQDTQLALTNINTIYSYFRMLIDFSHQVSDILVTVGLSEASRKIFNISSVDIERSLTAMVRDRHKILQISERIAQRNILAELNVPVPVNAPDSFEGLGQPLGGEPIGERTEEEIRSARLRKFEQQRE